ncbi:RloB domain-containing protein [Streptomyces klenkii]|uniref:RloB domain-containing protein n=1 Tax=Streptomyces klenkii TaxID=1420899 RepID=A0A3B0BPW2_9ACTN|nr:RloB family protein [Streptomyces klenkii]RKN74289.1 RloB domain-containing protein [Streptomyces klenkii]
MARTPKARSNGRCAPGPSFESNVLRIPGGRRARDRLLVVCGAKATEKDYLLGLVDHVANPAVTVRIRTKSCSPAQLITYAAGERDRIGDDFDQVWCVFDVDHFEVACAIDRARREGIRVAVSNPCFELWLILHFSGHTAPVRTYRELLPYLKRHVPAYEKARLDFRDFEHGWGEAGRRARRLATEGREHVTNPSTGVWALVSRIATR